MVPSGTKGQPAHRTSFPCRASDHRERHRLRRVRVLEIDSNNRAATSSTTTEMDTLQIDRLLTRNPRARSIFRGAVPKDGLPTSIDGDLPAPFLCNTDDGDEPGEHWIALYLAADGRGDYFCSYGLPPRLIISRYFRVHF